MPTTNNKGNILSELGIEKTMINNIFTSNENPELINKHKPQNEAKTKFVKSSKISPEAEVFCTLDTNPETMFAHQEEQKQLMLLDLENDFDEELFEIKSPESTITPPKETPVFDIKISSRQRTIKYRRKNKNTTNKEEKTFIHNISSTLKNEPNFMGTGKLRDKESRF